MYFGPPCSGDALNCYFEYLVVPVTRPLFMRTYPMELGYPENIKNLLNGIFYRFSEKFG